MRKFEISKIDFYTKLRGNQSEYLLQTTNKWGDEKTMHSLLELDNAELVSLYNLLGSVIYNDSGCNKAKGDN